MPLIEARGLRRTYGSTVAVDHVELDVHEGEIVGATDRAAAVATRYERGILPG